MPNHQSLDPGRQSDATLRRRSPDAAGPEADAEAAPHPLLNLQRQLGNATIARMIAQRQGAPEEEEQVQAKHDPALAQRQGAPEEEEPVQAKHDPALAQRQGAPEEEEPVQAKHDPALAQREGAPEEEEPVQAKHDPALAQREGAPEVGMEGGPISDSLAGRINAQRGGGAALPDAQREQMEGAFGTSFKDVRVHTGPEADSLNRGISAKAFTTGSDIFFRKDTSPNDPDLLGHELTHVVQQRSMSGGGQMTVGPAGDSHEQEADAMAQAARSAPASNGPGAALGQAAQGEGVQRQEAAPEEEEQAGA